MKTNKSAMVFLKLTALVLWGAILLSTVSSPVQAQTREQVSPVKNSCLAKNHRSCRIADTVGDFDGHSKTDYAVWRPSNGTWYVLSSFDTSEFFVQQWGLPGDVPVPGDYDGDGITDFAVWRPSNGTWYIVPSSNPTQYIVQQWGLPGDIPVPGDYDGDGTTDLAVWRPSNGTWYIIPSGSPGQFIVQQWGLAGDIPVPGDYDGHGQTDYAVWRPSNGTWYALSSFNPAEYFLQQWGLPGDIPAPGDYDGDGATDFAVWRPSNGTWYIIPSGNPRQYISQQWGLAGDVPVPGDYDGDGTTDFAVWRPSNGTWYVIPSSNPTQVIAQQWGLSTDLPVVDSAPETTSENAIVGVQVPALSSASPRMSEGASSPAPELAAVRCPAPEDGQCPKSRQAEVRPLSEAETVIGAHADRPVEQVVQRLRYSLPPGMERQVHVASPSRMIKQLSDAAQFMGVPLNMPPEEVGRTTVLPPPPADQKRP